MRIGENIFKSVNFVIMIHCFEAVVEKVGTTNPEKNQNFIFNVNQNQKKHFVSVRLYLVSSGQGQRSARLIRLVKKD